MKIRILILTLAIALCNLTGYAQRHIYDNLSGKKDIQEVHVSKSLLDMLSQMNTGGADISRIADKLKQVDVYTSKSTDAAKYMNNQVALIEKDASYETFMTIKEETQTVVFYGRKSGDVFMDLIMVTNDKSAANCTIVSMSGEFTAKDIKSILNKE